MKNGMVHIYIGDGKGKSTAAFGLALRCFGCGYKVLVLQFLKTRETGEVEAVRAMANERFVVKRFESEHDLVFDDATELDLEYLKNDIRNAFQYALEAVSSGAWDLVVLDELLWAVYFEFISLDEILEMLDLRHKSTELVLTGRFAAEEILNRADYITVMQAQRHPYEQGQAARKGIEF